MNIINLKDIKEEQEELKFYGYTINVKKHIPEAYKLYISKTIKDIYFGENILKSEPDSVLFAEDLSNKNLKHSLIVINVIRFYTDIEINEEDNLSTCDLVVESGLYDRILNIIPFSELDTLETIINDAIKEEQRKIDKENSFENYFKTFLTNLSEKLPSEDTIKQTMSDLPKMINEADPNKLKFIADAVAFNNGIKSNRQQRRKAEKKGDVNA